MCDGMHTTVCMSVLDGEWPVRHTLCACVCVCVCVCVTGALDSELLIEGAVLAPVVGGRVTFSRGSLNLQPPASSSAPTTATGTASALLSAQTAQDTQQYDSGPLHTPTAAESADALLVRSAFSLLRAGRKHAALVAATGAIDAPQTSTVRVCVYVRLLCAPCSTTMCVLMLNMVCMCVCVQGSVLHPPPAPSAPCQLSELQIVFGPELRASFPVVLNVAVSGQVRTHPHTPTHTQIYTHRGTHKSTHIATGAL